MDVANQRMWGKTDEQPLDLARFPRRVADGNKVAQLVFDRHGGDLMHVALEHKKHHHSASLDDMSP
jgi:hypothetical protein